MPSAAAPGIRNQSIPARPGPAPRRPASTSSAVPSPPPWAPTSCSCSGGSRPARRWVPPPSPAAYQPFAALLGVRSAPVPASERVRSTPARCTYLRRRGVRRGVHRAELQLWIGGLISKTSSHGITRTCRDGSGLRVEHRGWDGVH